MRALLAGALACACLTGCVSAEKLAAIDDAKCRSYGAQPGDPAYVQCRAQLDAARTQANATLAAAPTTPAPPIVNPVPPGMLRYPYP